ncbi:hypothetical protein KKF91_00665 [Myxococcota bacterium]|nr:hypothetical protein [Myxococcota bacterium]MBU1429046.1 hypothetical protein [Myxococcota bacterium]MBU1897744.1 hypothetical protein [Myxococcota bacterium]
MSERARKVMIRPYPSVIYLYPSFIAAIACGLWVQFGTVTPEAPGITGLFFTLMFFFNISIMAFDYTRLASIVIVLLVIILALVSALAPSVGVFIAKSLSIQLYMNALFYWVWAIALGVLFLVVFFKTRFDYWEVKNNELLHHHGMLGDVERWPAPNMRISKEINDVMEYALCRAGRLVLMPAREPRAIIIDNVIGIDHVEKQMQEILSALRIADDDPIV